jgi:hypothetical protein
MHGVGSVFLRTGKKNADTFAAYIVDGNVYAGILRQGIDKLHRAVKSLKVN